MWYLHYILFQLNREPSSSFLLLFQFSWYSVQVFVVTDIKCVLSRCVVKSVETERKRGAKIEKEREREGVIKRAAIFRWNVSWQKQNEASAAATAAVTTAVNLWTSLSHERKAIYCISWFTFLVASSICKKKFTKKSFAQTDNGFQSQRTAQLFQ